MVVRRFMAVMVIMVIKNARALYLAGAIHIQRFEGGASLQSFGDGLISPVSNHVTTPIQRRKRLIAYKRPSDGTGATRFDVVRCNAVE